MISSLRKTVLKLSDREPVGQGRRQLVFDHPDASDTLIKVLKPDTCDDQGNLIKQRWTDRFRKATAFAPFKREFEEFLDLKARFQNSAPDLPLCYIQGIVQTDLGVGFVFEKIADPDGTLSENLYDIVRGDTVSERHVSDLTPFFDALEENHVILGDLNMKNIVYQKRSDGTARYVCVDGTGSKQAIPLRKWFKSQNTKKVRQVHEKTARKIKAAIAKKTNANSAEVAGARDTA